jgi:Fe-S-cluster-containing dehydrogenase component/CRP-like cAMP-binding protein
MAKADAVGVARPQRWDVPFGEGLSERDVDRVMERPPFSRIEVDRFPPTLPLRGILLNDCRLRRFEAGDLVVRQGDYGNSAFFVLSGGVRVALGDGDDGLPASVLGRSVSRKKSLFEAFAQLWTSPRLPEVRALAAPLDAEGEGIGSRAEGPDEVRIFLQDVPGIIERHRTTRTGAGEFFGEIAALGRSPRTATVFAEEPSELLEIRWQGLRDIRRRAPELKQHIDQLYRQHSLLVHLRHTPFFQDLSSEELAEVARHTVFETYGEFDWYTRYKDLAELSAEERLAREPIIGEQGHYPNGLVLIRSGFARLSEHHYSGERTVAYLGKGKTYGLEETVHNWRQPERVPLQRTLRAVGYVDVLVVPTAIVERVVLPRQAPESLPPAVEPPSGEPEDAASATPTVPQHLLEFLAENRFINGTATMLVDLERCVRCDDCVKACAATHDNNPRFLRHGPRHGRYMVANACMHCVDPVCMIGCPTGAIHRDEAQGQVLINDGTCIGCSTCAQSCPYDNIRMVEIRDLSGALMADDQTGLPIVKATKCDLCIEQRASPACELACPHDALRRIDMQDLRALAKWARR